MRKMQVFFQFQVLRKLTTFFKSLGVKAVFDTSCSRDLSLIESCNEFISRYKQQQSTGDERCKTSLPMISSACPGILGDLVIAWKLYHISMYRRGPIYKKGK